MPKIAPIERHVDPEGASNTVSAPNADGATLRDFEAGDAAQRRRLAATARPQQREECTRFNTKPMLSITPTLPS